jgi:hypothetical protein
MSHEDENNIFFKKLAKCVQILGIINNTFKKTFGQEIFKK